MCSPLKDGVIIFYEYKMSTLLIYLITLFFFLYNNENTYHIQLKNNSSYVIKHDGNFTQYFSLLPFFSTKQKNLYLFFLLTYGRKLSFLSSLILIFIYSVPNETFVILSQMILKCWGIVYREYYPKLHLEIFYSFKMNTFMMMMIIIIII